MIVLGLLLLLASGTVALGVVLSNTNATSVEGFGLTVSNITLGGLFLAGAVTGLIFMLGLAMLAAGSGRKRRRRIETKHTVRDARTETEQLAEENTALRAQLSDPYPTEGATAPPSEPPLAASTGNRHERKGVFGRR